MISHKYKYIFVHIPKCLGTSVERVLLEHEGIKTTVNDFQGKLLYSTNRNDISYNELEPWVELLRDWTLFIKIDYWFEK